MTSMKTPPLKDPIRTTPGKTPENLVVACVWWGNKYSANYVYNLARACAHYLPPHQFHVLTDRCRPEHLDEWAALLKCGLTPRSLVTERHGWWQKLQLFMPGMFDNDERVLFLDLDVVLTDDITELVSVSDPFVMIENFGPNKHLAAHNSSAMLWTPSHITRRVWDEFADVYMRQLHGDQCWIWRVLDGHIANWPRELVGSYKYDVRGKRVRPPPLMVFHGEPKPPDTEWREVWAGKKL